MTSKEALSDLVFLAYAVGDKEQIDEFEKIIERNLEVLELLKRELFYEYKCFDLDEGWYDDSFSFSKDEQKKIKEWLEDEKTNK